MALFLWTKSFCTFLCSYRGQKERNLAEEKITQRLKMLGREHNESHRQAFNGSHIVKQISSELNPGHLHATCIVIKIWEWLKDCAIIIRTFLAATHKDLYAYFSFFVNKNGQGNIWLERFYNNTNNLVRIFSENNTR